MAISGLLLGGDQDRLPRTHSRSPLPSVLVFHHGWGRYLWSIITVYFQRRDNGAVCWFFIVNSFRLIFSSWTMSLCGGDVDGCWTNVEPKIYSYSYFVSIFYRCI